MGMVAYSNYSRASDLGNGIPLYAFLGIGGAVLTITSAIVLYITGFPANITTPFYIAAIFAVMHSLVTTQAAPINFSQRKVANDEIALAGVFRKFERWQTIRVIFVLLTFLVMLWAITVFIPT